MKATHIDTQLNKKVINYVCYHHTSKINNATHSTCMQKWCAPTMAWDWPTGTETIYSVTPPGHEIDSIGLSTIVTCKCFFNCLPFDSGESNVLECCIRHCGKLEYIKNGISHSSVTLIPSMLGKY